MRTKIALFELCNFPVNKKLKLKNNAKHLFLAERTVALMLQACVCRLSSVCDVMHCG